jgi:hypothetical protein
MERVEYRQLGFPIQAKERGEIRVNTAAYEEDLMLYAEKGDGIRVFLDLLAKFCNHAGMKINVKKCVALAELWDGDRAVKMTEPYFYREDEEFDFGLRQKWGEPEQMPMGISSLYLGTTIAFNKEDEAKHWKHILDSMRENITAIGRSKLNITQKLHAIKTFELPRIDFRTMCVRTFANQTSELSTHG